MLPTTFLFVFVRLGPGVVSLPPSSSSDDDEMSTACVGNARIVCVAAASHTDPLLVRWSRRLLHLRGVAARFGTLGAALGAGSQCGRRQRRQGSLLPPTDPPPIVVCSVDDLHKVGGIKQCKRRKRSPPLPSRQWTCQQERPWSSPTAEGGNGGT